MVSESSRSSRRRGSAQKKGILCGHGERPVLRVSRTKENPGRRFWGCVYYEVNDECEFFRWEDPEAGSEDPHVARLKRKVVDLKADVKASEWKLKVAAVLGMVGWVACKNLAMKVEIVDMKFDYVLPMHYLYYRVVAL
ncbi:uncharacterized protein LOC107611631 [Arachis ipaensis]|uniref:uncharacterized protein LOC107611631 n=1 Tax=Arachis ipaensis TaxID=130454 RepID=UPI0007AF43B6|nr:uncharacterized protein LOC107611631 [Arachis ipaensis]